MIVGETAVVEGEIVVSGVVEVAVWSTVVEVVEVVVDDSRVTGGCDDRDADTSSNLVSSFDCERAVAKPVP